MNIYIYIYNMGLYMDYSPSFRANPDKPPGGKVFSFFRVLSSTEPLFWMYLDSGLLLKNLI